MFFSSVVTSCNELELFDLSGCDLVTNATVQAALDSVKLRPSNVKLKLVVGGELNYSADSLRAGSGRSVLILLASCQQT